MLVANVRALRCLRPQYNRITTLLYRFNHTEAVSIPLKEYKRLVKIGTLRDDEYQKGIISSLGHLYDSLVNYKPPEVKTPSALDQLSLMNSLKSKLDSLVRAPPRMFLRYQRVYIYMVMLDVVKQCSWIYSTVCCHHT